MFKRGYMMPTELIEPRAAIEKLMARGVPLAEINRFLGKPGNYASRVLRGEISEPSYLIADKLRSLIRLTGREPGRNPTSQKTLLRSKAK